LKLTSSPEKIRPIWEKGGRSPPGGGARSTNGGRAGFGLFFHRGRTGGWGADLVFFCVVGGMGSPGLRVGFSWASPGPRPDALEFFNFFFFFFAPRSRRKRTVGFGPDVRCPTGGGGTLGGAGLGPPPICFFFSRGTGGKGGGDQRPPGGREAREAGRRGHPQNRGPDRITGGARGGGGRFRGRHAQARSPRATAGASFFRGEGREAPPGFSGPAAETEVS